MKHAERARRPRRRLIPQRVLPLLLAVAAALPVPTVGWGAAAAQDADAALPLWEVTRDGHTLYLLGSVHLLRPEVYPLDAAIYDAFDAADMVAFELDFREASAAAPAMIALGQLEEGESLADLIPARLYEDVMARAAALGLPAPLIDGLKPWLVALTLSSMVIQQGGFEAGAGIDMHFFERGESADKRMFGLETAEEQVRLFDRLGPEAQTVFLRQTLEELDSTVEQLDAATVLWQRGDADGLAAMFAESMGDQVELMEALLYQRNRSWIQPIEELLAEADTAMVIVGMGHLVGEGSVIDLLEARGHRVERVGVAVRK